MRAVLIKNNKGPLDNLFIGDAETPAAAERQLLVKVRDLRPTRP